VVALALSKSGEAAGRTGGSGAFGGWGGVGVRRGRHVAEQVAQEAAGTVDRGAVVGEAAQDVRADGGGGVARREPAEDQPGQLVVHAPGDAAEVRGEVGEGGDEGAGGFGDVGSLGRLRGGDGGVRLGRTVGGVFPGVFLWMTVGGRRGRSAGGRNAGTRYELG
jgi:hypothetical protein